MPNTSPKRRPKRWMAFVLLAVGMALVFWWSFVREVQPKGPPVVLNPFSPGVVQKPPPIPDRWIPRTWGWAWRTKEFVLGKRKPLAIDGRVLSLSSDSRGEGGFHSLTRAADLKDSNGLEIWLLSSNELSGVRKEITALGCVLTAGRITLGEKSEGRLSTQSAAAGMPPLPSAGLVFDVYPVIHKDLVSVSVALSYSQFVTNDPTISIKTNLAVNGVFQVPSGSGVLMVKAEPGETNRFGFLMIPSFPLRK